jgi:hypothetical protein
MEFEQILQTLHEHWDELAPALSPDTRRLLGDLLDRLAAQGEGELTWEARNELVDLLLEVLPEDHPVRAAVLDTQRGTAVLEDWTTVARELLAQLDDGLDDDPGLVPVSPREVRYWATRRLLAAPSLTEDDLHRIGLDPDDPRLIHLERYDGSSHWPEFQFGPDGGPVPLVLAINRMLDAEEDPWGAADWWLGPNSWLGDVPARLLGRVSDDLLVSAARAVDPGV